MLKVPSVGPDDKPIPNTNEYPRLDPYPTGEQFQLDPTIPPFWPRKLSNSNANGLPTSVDSPDVLEDDPRELPSEPNIESVKSVS